MPLSIKSGSFSSSSRSTSNGWYTEERLKASKTSESMIDAAKDVRKTGAGG
jgi:hypothetical protein